MANILILGAGSMGTAFSFPCSDNNHVVSIIGTHLENDFIEKFIDRVVEEKPEMIVVQDKQNKNVGCISSKRLSEILKK